MKYRWLVIIVGLMLLLPSITAQKQMKLVAVAEHQGQLSGSVADLYIETKPGTGRVFMDTFPLTKSDTQLSTRFAKEIACNFLNKECNDRDFFYTIRAESGIIGGPSAGAAIALLTIAELEGIDLDLKGAVTGTINNGGLIGPVGGIKEKIDGAIAANLTKLLIPRGKRFVKPDADRLLVVVNTTSLNFTNTTVRELLNITNTTLDLLEYVQNTTLSIAEVDTLEDALYELTGENYTIEDGTIQNDTAYQETMSSIAGDLCNRTSFLFGKVQRYAKNNTAPYQLAFQQHNKSIDTFKKGNFYSAASFCFGANIQLNVLLLNITHVNKSQISTLSYGIQDGIYELNREVENRSLNTITDLQTYMIVKERLADAEESNLLVHTVDNKTNISIDLLYNLAYANERLYSANVWSMFFDTPGKPLNLDHAHVRDSCLRKLAEAEERIQYVQLMIPRALSDTITLHQSAEDDYNKGQFAFCLFKASRAKAEADVILSVAGVEDAQIKDYLAVKLELVRKNIIKQQKKGLFPILAYSYYEYASVLSDNPASALLYAEYALELSHLDLYFEPSPKQWTAVLARLQQRLNYVYTFVLGCLLGILIGYIAKVMIEKNRSQRMKRNALVRRERKKT